MAFIYCLPINGLNQIQIQACTCIVEVGEGDCLYIILFLHFQCAVPIICDLYMDLVYLSIISNACLISCQLGYRVVEVLTCICLRVPDGTKSKPSRRTIGICAHVCAWCSIRYSLTVPICKFLTILVCLTQNEFKVTLLQILTNQCLRAGEIQLP